MTAKMIGIVGGVGSYAGLDLLRKIYDHSGARSDPEHLPVAMISEPATVVDRTEFLLGKTDQNPGDAIGRIITKLVAVGAQVIGIPCNTAHAPPIFDVIGRYVPTGCTLLHMIEEVGRHIGAAFPRVECVGVLSTTGTHSAKIYPVTLSKTGLKVLQPDEATQHQLVHPAIYDPAYGIKAQSNPVHERALRDLRSAAAGLVQRGAEVVILGCTETALALAEPAIEGRPVIDATAVLAAAFVRAATVNSTHSQSVAEYRQRAR